MKIGEYIETLNGIGKILSTGRNNDFILVEYKNGMILEVKFSNIINVLKKEDYPELYL